MYRRAPSFGPDSPYEHLHAELMAKLPGRVRAIPMLLLGLGVGVVVWFITRINLPGNAAQLAVVLGVLAYAAAMVCVTAAAQLTKQSREAALLALAVATINRQRFSRPALEMIAQRATLGASDRAHPLLPLLALPLAVPMLSEASGALIATTVTSLTLAIFAVLCVAVARDSDNSAVSSAIRHALVEHHQRQQQSRVFEERQEAEVARLLRAYGQPTGDYEMA